MKTSLMLVALLALKANAGYEHGNGGDVLVCNVNYTELLDFYEARELRGLHVNIRNTKSSGEVLQIFVERIQKFSPARAAMYKEWMDSFLDETHFTEGELTDIKDSHHVAIPRNCRIEQIAIQKAPLFPEDSRYIISRPLWDLLANEYCASSIDCSRKFSTHIRLDSQGSRVGAAYPKGFGQAALIIHEIVLREALKMGQPDSIKARYFASYVMSDNYKLMKQDDFDKLIQITGLDGKLK